MIAKQLTMNTKIKLLRIIIERDGDICFYCLMLFVPEVQKWTREFDHMNNDDTDHRVENLVLAHRECNNKKKSSFDWQLMAQKKLEENMKSGYVGVRGKNLQVDTSAEIDSNTEFNRIALEYLTEILLPHGKNPAIEEELDFKDTLDNVTLRCYNLYKHASQNTIRRILDMFCASEGDFEKTKQNGRWKIGRRKGK